jgi:hypothetical protein
MSLLFEIIRLLTVAVGLGVVYVAAFTYEGTDRLIQNWLEDLWLRLAYDSGTPVGIARRLVRVVLSLTEKILDRLFGPRQVSIRTLSVALCYAYGALLLTDIPLRLYVSLAELELPKVLEGWGQPHIILAAAAFAMGTLPAVHASLRWVTYLTVFCILASLALSVWVLTTSRPEVTAVVTAVLGSAIEGPGGILASLVVALTYGIGLVHAIRYGIKRTVHGEANRRDVVLVGSVLMIPFVAFAALASVAVIARHPRGQLTLWLASLMQREGVRFLLFTLGGPLSLWGLGLFIGLALSFVVLFHVTMWPVIRFVLMKTVYAAQRHELITRKGRLWSIGLALVLCATVPRELLKLVTMIMSAVR